MLAVIADTLKLGTPAQQLLDRFLIGYPVNGKFQRAEGRKTFLHLTTAGPARTEIERRVKDFGLIEENNLEEALSRADSVVVAGAPPVPVINALRPGSKSFLYGALTKQMLAQAHAKGCKLISGTATRGAIELPSVHVEAFIAKALIIVQGPYPTAEVDALDGLLPLIRANPCSIKEVQFLTGDDLWRTLKKDFWPLVKAAVSRSDTPQGDAVLDGRTQDLAKLGLIEALAKNPRSWIVQHDGGLISVLLVLDGVVADYNFALQTKTGRIISAQLYRPPPPAEHHYSNLAALLDKFFATGIPPWPVSQNMLAADLLERFERLYRP